MITIVLSMYDRSRRASVRLPATSTVGELLEQCTDRWQLPEASFAVRHVQTNRLLLETDSLQSAGIEDGMELQIFPLLEGGSQ